MFISLTSLLVLFVWHGRSLPPSAVDFFSDEGTLKSHFLTFLQTYGKAYAYQDEASLRARMAIFAKNVDFIHAFNGNSTSGGIQLGINQFADLTSMEFRTMYLSSLSPAPTDKEQTRPVVAYVRDDLPEHVDWRDKGAVTPVKDQKNCGACWAFSTIGAIEGAWFLSGHPLVSLSEQELVDCSASFRGGCSGGEPSDAFTWVAKHGICDNKSYPWTAFQDECHNQFNPCRVAARIDGYSRVQQNNELALKAAVAQKPISVQIEADTDIFRFYKSGVLKDIGCGTALDHAVLAVGYGTQDGQDYWLVKNSWNSSWGEQGYVRLARTDSTASWGECGIAMHPMFPIISSESLLV